MNIQLTDDAIIELAREGDIAFIPGLRSERRFVLPLGEPEEQAAASIGRGDQRYFRIQISYATHREAGTIVILIPENGAPPELRAGAVAQRRKIT